MHDRKAFRLQLLLGGALLATMTVPAFAETAPAPAPAADEAQSPPTRPNTDSGQLADIVVTATEARDQPPEDADRDLRGHAGSDCRPPCRQPDRSGRRRHPVAAHRHVRGAPVGADRRHPRHRAVRREPDGARPGRRRLYRRRLSRPPAGPQRRPVRRRARRGAARPAGHAVRPQHRRRRAQHRHQGPDRRIRRPRLGQCRQLRQL